MGPKFYQQFNAAAYADFDNDGDLESGCRYHTKPG